MPFPAERDVAAAFDHKTREGVVVMRAGGRFFSRRFDDEGTLLGSVVDLGQIDGPLESLTRAEKDWFAFIRGTEPRLINLTSPREPAALPYEHKALALHEENGKLHVVSFEDGSYWNTPLKEDGSASGKPVLIAKLPENSIWNKVEVVTSPDAPPLLLIPLSEDRKTFSGLAWIHLRPGASWSSEELPQDLSQLNKMTTRRLNGDVAVLFNRDWNGSFTDGVHLDVDKKWRILWVKAKRALTVDSGTFEQSQLSNDAAGAWLQATLGSVESSDEEPKFLPLKTLLLPEQPGPLVEEPALGFVRHQCSRALTTGPSTLVLVCAEAPDEVSPGVRMGLRTFHMKR